MIKTVKWRLAAVAAIILALCVLPCATLSYAEVNTVSGEKYVDKITSAANVGQRADTYNISILTDNVGAVGDTSRAVYGSNPSAAESYLDYTLKNQDTVVVYAYEKIFEGNVRPQTYLPKFSVFGVNWEVDATQTEVEIGRYVEPMRYTRIKLTYKLDSPVSGKVRIHIYSQSQSDLLQIGRVEIYNRTAVTEAAVKGSDSAFSVSGWITPPDVGYGNISDSVDFENAMAELAQSGINLNLPNVWNGDTLYYRKRLTDVCTKLGIKTLVYDEELINYLKRSSGYNKETARAMVEAYASDESFAGHFIMDEPNVKQLNELRTAATRYHEILPGKTFYVNLFPDYAISDYSDYLDTYFDTVQECRISYDYYVLQGKTPSEYSMKTTHLCNLQTAAEKAAEHNADLYAIIASTGHYNSSDKVYLRDIDGKADLGFQAYSALAYGAKGLTWFTYCAMSPDIYGAQPGMLDSSGEKTKVYGYVTELNGEIRAFADKYLTYDWTGTMLVGSGDNPNFASVNNSLAGHGAVSEADASHDVIIGTFDNGENDALMIVNYNDPSLNTRPEVTVTFDKPYALNIYSGGVNKHVKMKSNTYTFYLTNGGGTFIELLPVNSFDNEQGSGPAAPDDENKPDAPDEGTKPSDTAPENSLKNGGCKSGVSAVSLPLAVCAFITTLIIGLMPKKHIRRKIK